MRHRLLVLVLAAAVAACGSAPGGAPASALPTLGAADSALQAAVTGRDLDGIMHFYLDDALLLPTAEPMVVGKAAIREEWQHILAIPDMQSQGALTKLEVSANGDMGYTMGTYVAHMQGEDGQPVVEPGKFLTVWKRQDDGSWRIAVDTYNTDVPPPDHK